MTIGEWGVRFDFRDVPTVIADEDSSARQPLQRFLKSMFPQP
jgi:hypothetical protein